MRGNFSRSATINHTHKLLYCIVSCTFVQYTKHNYKLQQYIIPLLLLSGQRTMHRGLVNEKSLLFIRPVSARKARGPGFSGPARGRPGQLPSLITLFKIRFSIYHIACLLLSYYRNSIARAAQPKFAF